MFIVSNNIVLPKGSTCYLCPLATHRDSASYSNPTSFNPDNFSPENIAKRHKYSFIGFSGGPRGCIGKKHLKTYYYPCVTVYYPN